MAYKYEPDTAAEREFFRYFTRVDHREVGGGANTFPADRITWEGRWGERPIRIVTQPLPFKPSFLVSSGERLHVKSGHHLRAWVYGDVSHDEAALFMLIRTAAKPYHAEIQLCRDNFKPPDVPMFPLRWSDGTDSKDKGDDLASVIRERSNEDLVYFLSKMRNLPHEKSIIRSELESRNVSADTEDIPGQLLLLL
mgnify:CR=1 FL=1|jgi:hypothetical protein|tara:strand:+ start:1431 stop:2015 length:585 start_codon:yes stop_codon:yes gene_type:complete